MRAHVLSNETQVSALGSTWRETTNVPLSHYLGPRVNRQPGHCRRNLLSSHHYGSMKCFMNLVEILRSTLSSPGLFVPSLKCPGRDGTRYYSTSFDFNYGLKFCSTSHSFSPRGGYRHPVALLGATGKPSTWLLLEKLAELPPNQNRYLHACTRSTRMENQTPIRCETRS